MRRLLLTDAVIFYRRRLVNPGRINPLVFDV